MLKSLDTVLFTFRTDTAFWQVDHYHWMWPFCETAHFIGMALLVGIVGVLDLRMLGVAKGLPVAPLQRLVPWAVLGFAINLVTGAIFVSSSPGNYASSWAFRFKMLFILTAGVNVLVFYVSGLARDIGNVGAGEDAPRSAKIVAVISLCMWLGVMFWGRMLPYLLLGSSNAE